MPQMGPITGMRFAPTKYTLTHFSKCQSFDLQAPVQLQEVEVQPQPVVRILELQLDTKLCCNSRVNADPITGSLSYDCVYVGSHNA